MAYNSRYNPDALPAFAEPERRQPSSSSSSSRPARRASPQNQQQKPHPTEPRQRPAQPQKLRPIDDQPRIRPGPGSSSSSYHHDGHASPSAYASSHGYPSQGPGAASQQPPQQYQQYQSQAPQQPPIIRQLSHSQSAQSAQSRTPSSPAITTPPTTDPSLLPLFRAVDKRNTGYLTEKELSDALVNGDYTKFDVQTVRMMIRMFDADGNGGIAFDEFVGLWGFLAAWRALFDRFDVDGSGGISLDEYGDALVAFGYRLSDSFVKLLFHTYDKYNRQQISFDLFVQSCISLKRMTDVFKRYDTDRDGVIELKFEDFLSEILRLGT